MRCNSLLRVTRISRKFLKTMSRNLSSLEELKVFEESQKETVSVWKRENGYHFTVRTANSDPKQSLLTIIRDDIETVESTLSRVAKKLEVALLGPAPKKKKTGGVVDRSAPPPRISMSLLSKTETLDSQQSNNSPDTWKSAEKLRIKGIEEGDKSWDYNVLYDPPEIPSKIIHLERTPQAGVPQQILILEQKQCDIKTVWFTSEDPKQTEELEDKKKKKGGAKQIVKKELTYQEVLQKDITQVSEGDTYTPTSDDGGKVLISMMVPSRGDLVGQPKFFISGAVIVPKDDLSLGFQRFPLKNTSVLRIMTYNILYEGATVIYATGKSMYPYADPLAIETDYRKQRILREIKEHDPEIVCFQEMSDAIHSQYLLPNLPQHDGVYVMKTGQSRDGLSTVWNTDRFSKQSSHDISLGKDIPTDIPGCENLYEYLNKFEKVKTCIEKVTTVAQVTHLKCTETGKSIIVANTHLWFHPLGSHIRVLQLHVLMSFAAKIAREESAEGAKIVLCGDLNFQPKSAPHRYCMNNLDKSHQVWWNAQNFDFSAWDFESGEVVDAEEKTTADPCDGPDIVTPFVLSDATPEFTFTNYTPGFTGRLDYILHSSSLEVSSVHPQPPREVLGSEGGGIPSLIFPSDHLPICVDFNETT